MLDMPKYLLNIPLAAKVPLASKTLTSLRVFLWGTVVGAACSLVAGAFSLRERWKKARDEGRVEERRKLESEILTQRRESDLRRREAEVRCWEIEDAQAEIQRLQWELKMLRERQEELIVSRDEKISLLEAELARMKATNFHNKG